MKKKTRLDNLLIDLNLFETRSQARAAILERKILVNRTVVDKAGHQVSSDDTIEILENTRKFVSRGGDKLDGAAADFDLNFYDKVVMDVGASTGGFTDYALKNGAKKVYAIDVGYGQFDWSLRHDDRVVLFERTNIRELKPNLIDDPIDIVLIDVSFISLTKIVKNVITLLCDDGEMVALIKPQFEAGRQLVGKNGVVKDPKTHIDVIKTVWTALVECEMHVEDISASKIKGPKGNIEFFIYAKKREDIRPPDEKMIAGLVAMTHQHMD